MNQPDLGLKVSELRQLKNLTQEQLAERCEVSARTIQRIESGEVDPRAYTLQRLSEALEFNFEEPNPANENLWLTILHLSSAICMLIIPLLLWSWKKSYSLKIDTQGRQVLNFQITMTLLLITGGFLLITLPVALIALDEWRITNLESGPAFMLLTLYAPVPLIATGLFCTFQGVMNATRSVSDRPVHYPISIPFLK